MTAKGPNRSITELKSGRSLPAFFGREVLRLLECVGQVAVLWVQLVELTMRMPYASGKLMACYTAINWQIRRLCGFA